MRYEKEILTKSEYEIIEVESFYEKNNEANKNVDVLDHCRISSKRAKNTKIFTLLSSGKNVTNIVLLKRKT